MRDRMGEGTHLRLESYRHELHCLGHAEIDGQKRNGNWYERAGLPLEGWTPSRFRGIGACQDSTSDTSQGSAS